MSYIERVSYDFKGMGLIVNIIKVLGNNPKIFIAGGCFKNILSGEKPKDIDVFFYDEKTYNQTYKKLKDAGYKLKYTTNKVSAFIIPEYDIVVELIFSRFYLNSASLLGSFDFTICKMSARYDSINLHGVTLLIHERFFEDLSNKRLYLDDKIEFPVSTFERLIRYVGYGFKPCRQTKVSLLKALKGTAINYDLSISLSLYDGGGLNEL